MPALTGSIRDIPELYGYIAENAGGQTVPTSSYHYYWSAEVSNKLREVVRQNRDALLGVSSSFFIPAYNVKAYGAVGDGSADDTQPFRDASAAAFSASFGTIFIPSGTYRITDDVDFRRIGVLSDNATISVDDSDAMVILGGRANQGFQPRQHLYRVLRNGGATSSPTIRVIGAKNQTISVDMTDYMQLWASSRHIDDQSIAYSRFDLNYITSLLEIDSDVTEPSGPLQWINENTFFLCRIRGLRISGTYHHNHNRFVGGNFENSTIDIEKGYSNTFNSPRFEGGCTINLASGTWANKITPTWESNPVSPFRLNGDGYTYTLIDSGTNNITRPLHDIYQHRLPIFVANEATCQVFTNNTGPTSFSRGPNYTSIKGLDLQRLGPETFQRFPFRTVFESPLIPVKQGEGLFFASDASAFRCIVRCYDSDRNQILDTNPALASALQTSNLVYVSGSNWYQNFTNVNESIAVVMEPSVAFLEFDIATGNATQGIPIRWLSLHKVTGRSERSLWGESNFMSLRDPAVSGSAPTIGFAEAGFKVSDLTGGWYTAARSLSTTLSGSTAVSGSTVSLTSTGEIQSGDVIGILLDDGNWHWTSVDGAPSAPDVDLTDPITAAASAGNRVVSNGWISS